MNIILKRNRWFHSFKIFHQANDPAVVKKWMSYFERTLYALDKGINNRLEFLLAQMCTYLRNFNSSEYFYIAPMIPYGHFPFVPAHALYLEVSQENKFSEVYLEVVLNPEHCTEILWLKDLRK